MTVLSDLSQVSYAGDNVSTSFGTSPMVFFVSTDLFVTKVTDATGVSVTLVEGTDYAVTGGNGAVGTVNLAGGSIPHGPLLVGTTLIITRLVALTQGTDFVNGDQSDAEVVEKALDRLTMMAQQFDPAITGALKAPITELADQRFSSSDWLARASKFVYFDSGGTLTLTSTFVPGALTVTAFIQTLLDDADAPTALNTLKALTASRASNTILAAADIAKWIKATASFTQTLTAAATLGDGWWLPYQIDSGATITFDPNGSENIDGATTKVVVGPAAGLIYCTGTQFFTLGFEVINAARLGTSVMGASNTLINGTLLHSRSANAETIAIKTLAGTDPSASNPVYVVFRNTTITTGDYAVITLTAAISFTISSGSTLGAINATAFKLWIVGFNDAGTFRLGVINAVALATTQPTIYPLGQFPIASSTAEGGAGTADSAQVFYTGTAVSSKAYTILGCSTWETGLTTAGTWVTAPTRTQLFGPNVPLPGAVIQTVRTDTGAVATGTTVLPYDDTIPQNTEGDQYMSQAITPTSSAHLLNIKTSANASSSGATTNSNALFQDAVAGALRCVSSSGQAVTLMENVRMDVLVLANTGASTTFKLRIGYNAAATTTFNGVSSARMFGGVIGSFIQIQEIAT